MAAIHNWILENDALFARKTDDHGDRMRFLMPKYILAAVLTTFLYPLVAAEQAIRISEPEMRAVFLKKEISITVPVLNNSGKTITGEMRMELLDHTDAVLASAETPAKLNPGNSSIAVHIKSETDNPPKTQLWQRLRYRLLENGKPLAQGIVALGAITPEMFELGIAHAKDALPGKLYSVRIHAANPVIRRPVRDVQVRGELSFDSAGHPVIVKGITNASGDAVLSFRIPRDTNEGGSIKIDAHNGSHVEASVFDFDLDSRVRIIINTDKLLYQPGQALHARAIVATPDKRVIADETVEFRLRNLEDETILSGKSTTNEFGIASIDWDLPDSAELGYYELQVTLPNSDRYESEETANIRISRYELPNFTVTAKPDRAYYLPDQNASIEVFAKYLVGKPVTTGSVRLVRQIGEHWDRAQHRYIQDEDGEFTSELDKSGRSAFQVNLTELHSDLAALDRNRFKDITFSAYVTDKTSGRTEQRRFTIRLSREPIHLYIWKSFIMEGRASFYASTYYPDGTPAECQISISEDPHRGEDSSDKSGNPAERQFLRKTRTNSYGVIKVADLPLLNDGDKHRLIFDVREKNGIRTTLEETIYKDSHNYILVTTDKALYKEREQIVVSVHTQQIPSGPLAVDLYRDSTVLWTGRIKLRNNRGFTIIPYSAQLRGELTIAVYSLETDSGREYDIPYGSCRILFPDPSMLKVRINTDRNTYKPGEETTAIVDVTMPSGLPAAGALGAVVIDKAVEERMRTDQEFGAGHYGFWDWSWLYPTASVGGITVKDLNELDLSQPLPEGMELVAEMLLQEAPEYLEPEIEGYSYNYEMHSGFMTLIMDRLKPVYKALLDENAASWKFAENAKEVAAVLKRAGIDINDAVDPWNTPYRFSFSAEYRDRTIYIRSAGPDKQFDTSDDISVDRLRWEYFKPYGKLIDITVKDMYASTGSYVRDFNTLNAALVPRNVDLAALRDPWGNPYSFSFEIRGSLFQVNVQIERPQDPYPRIAIWTSSVDYFERMRSAIDTTIYEYYRSAHLFPKDDASFDKAMANGNIPFRGLVDPWGHAYYVRYGSEFDYGRKTGVIYNPDVRIQNVDAVTRKIDRIRIWSSGSDGKPATEDDFSLAVFSQEISEQSGQDLTPRQVLNEPLYGNTGAVRGSVKDESGGALPGAAIVAKMDQTGQEFTISTGDDGSYIIRNLPPGTYGISFSMPGFKPVLVHSVPVHATSITIVEVVLRIAGVSTMVEVTASKDDLMLDASAEVEVAVTRVSSGTEKREATFTPRLRDYFPETLYWAPSIVTDAGGHARLKFKLADNITTWKMTVVASTKTGGIGVAEKEIEAFQPFFLDHDPPKVLTVGDAIDLPVVVRNYLPQAQKLNIEMKPASWYELQGPGKQQISVDAGESKSMVFPFKTTAMVKSGKQQVYAANSTTGDAIEKIVRVHPDGLELSATVSAVLGGDDSLQLRLSRDIIPGSLNARIKIYPNLIAHVTESIEATLERPYGCGEQTISSTYPSVMLLKYYKASGSANTPLKNKALRYLKTGYQRLLNYRATGGGFSYWGHGDADIALTSYAIRFLSDASAFTEIDPEIIPNAWEWLVSQQDANGRWHPPHGHDDSSLTAYVAVTLAQISNLYKDQSANSLRVALSRALTYLGDPHQVVESPYALAQFALAASHSGDKQKATAILNMLVGMAIQERGGYYWALTGNSPFYAWGRAGRIESTAMVILALSKLGSESPEIRRFIDGGTLWLLQQKDRYGIWYSGQATMIVLAAILNRISTPGTTATDAHVTVFVNGRPIELDRAALQSDVPVILDISNAVKAGDNSIRVKSTGLLPAASIQTVADYSVPWNGASAREVTRPGNPEALRLAVRFDRTEAAIGEKIQCSVEAERIGSYGWGMMVAEIGLPPGADVDRATLDESIKEAGWAISRYDILPDRLLLYLWPRAGGVKFAFSFKPRYGIRARSAQSTLYDYYNPDAHVTVPPADFLVGQTKPVQK
jgi:hypothetical protein